MVVGMKDVGSKSNLLTLSPRTCPLSVFPQTMLSIEYGEGVWEGGTSPTISGVVVIGI